jgi:hypothetical protein
MLPPLFDANRYNFQLPNQSFLWMTLLIVVDESLYNIHKPFRLFARQVKYSRRLLRPLLLRPSLAEQAEFAEQVEQVELAETVDITQTPKLAEPPETTTIRRLMAEMPMGVTAVAPMAVTLATKQNAEAKKSKFLFFLLLGNKALVLANFGSNTDALSTLIADLTLDPRNEYAFYYTERSIVTAGREGYSHFIVYLRIMYRLYFGITWSQGVHLNAMTMCFFTSRELLYTMLS